MLWDVVWVMDRGEGGQGSAEMTYTCVRGSTREGVLWVTGDACSLQASPVTLKG